MEKFFFEYVPAWRNVYSGDVHGEESSVRMSSFILGPGTYSYPYVVGSRSIVVFLHKGIGISSEHLHGFPLRVKPGYPNLVVEAFEFDYFKRAVNYPVIVQIRERNL